MQFSTFSANALRDAPHIQLLNFRGQTYKVEYQAFCEPANLGKTPVVFLGGAFQSFVYPSKTKWNRY